MGPDSRVLDKPMLVESQGSGTGTILTKDLEYAVFLLLPSQLLVTGMRTMNLGFNACLYAIDIK